MKESQMPDPNPDEVVGPDGVRYQFVFTAEAEVTRPELEENQ